ADDLAGAEARGRLAAFVRDQLAASSVEVTALAPLRGGAIQENWAADLAIEGGQRPGRHALVLRRDAATRVGESLGRAVELARLHRVTPTTLGRFLAPGAPGLDFLPLPRQGPALDQVARYRDALDRLGPPRPVLEWGLRWLERHAPPPGELVLVHQDFRT